MASSATRWVRWRIKVKAHVLALICPSTAPSLIRGCGSTSAPSAVTDEGLSVEEYTTILEMAQTNPQVRQKIIERMQAPAPLD